VAAERRQVAALTITAAIPHRGPQWTAVLASLHEAR
jgi:hypothetical protein